MEIDLSVAIKKLKEIETQFNSADSDTERYNILMIYNKYVSEVLPFPEHFVDSFFEKMLMEKKLIGDDEDWKLKY